VDSPNCEWVVSEEILAEYQDVLSRKKFKLTDEVRKEWLDIIDLVTTLVDVQVTIDFARDRKDEKFLACAIAAGADFLITGDADFNQAQNLVNTTQYVGFRFSTQLTTRNIDAGERFVIEQIENYMLYEHPSIYSLNLHNLISSSQIG
jgi:putative PIN family toxin of toxin-antitoxin system